MAPLYPKPHILTELPHHGHAIIEASAGTGKTFTLEHLIVDLLLRHEDVDLSHILTVTFTERATGELKMRVRRLIGKVLDASQRPGEDTQSSELLDATDPSRMWVLDGAARAKLERAFFSFDLAPIYTIHAFCQRVLTEYAFANQRFFDQRHIEFGPLFERTFTDTMRRTLACDERTRDWLEAWLETSTVDELKQMLMRTMNARAELWPRYDEARLLKGLERFGETFWDHYSALYARNARNRQLVFEAASADWAESRSIARFLMRADTEINDLKHSLRTVTPKSDEQVAFLDLAGALVRFKPAVVQTFLPWMRRAIETQKGAQGLYTFEDMLEKVWQGLERPQTGPWLVSALRRRYRFALIDEFQDTDDIQWKIFKRLFVEDAPSTHRLFIIGDPKQAIYGFRNADVYTYIEACRELTSPLLEEGDEPDEDEAVYEELGDPAQEHGEEEEDALSLAAHTPPQQETTQLYLQQNWRSTSELIDAYNHIFDQSETLPFFQGDEIRYTHPVTCGDPSLHAHDAQGDEIAPIVLGAIAPQGSATTRMADIYGCYGAWIAREIAHLLSDEGALYFGPRGQERRLGPRDIYVLTRTRSDEAKLEEYFRALDIPYSFYKQGGLFQTEEAQHIYDVLRASERPRDRGRSLRAWASPFFSIELEELVQCRDLPHTDPLVRAIERWHHLARKQRFEELFEEILSGSGIVRRQIFFAEDERALTNYMHICEVLLEEVHLGRLDISELVMRCRSFLDGERKPLGEEGDIKRVEDAGDAVQIMTMHKSKGLEAPVVFLYPFGGMRGDYWRFHYRTREGERRRAMHILKPDEKISPRLRTRCEQENYDEDARLLYVAVTRAMARLYLPFVPYAGKSTICRSISSRSYAVLNQRLRPIWDACVEKGEHTSWFECRDLVYTGGESLEPPPSPHPRLLSSWSPPSLLLPASEQAHVLPLAAKTLRVESYSSLKKRSGGYHLTTTLAGEQERGIEDELGSHEDAVSSSELPGGVHTGLFLHDVLERLDYSTLTRYADFDTWAISPSVSSLFARLMLEHGVPRDVLQLSQRVIWRALNAVVPVEGEGVIFGLGHCLPNIRELEFMYPIPQAQHPAFGETWRHDIIIERGFIKGYIDYVFEWNGKIFLADWKSDLLDRYDLPTLTTHVWNNYATQALLYSLALCKMFGMEDAETYTARFGGAVYCFLRGMQDDSEQGIYRWCPSWDDITRFDASLRLPDFEDALAALTPPDTLQLEG